jgi:uncharacterized protein (TIGR00369 family)
MELPPFTQYLGVEVERADGGEAIARLELQDHHRNRRGVAHGGVIAALLDTALGAAIIGSMPKEWWCATTSLAVQFLEGPREGAVIATGRVTRRGARVAHAAGEARDERGRLLATAQGTWNLWSHHPGRVQAAPMPFVVVRESARRIQVGKIVAVGRNYAAHVAEMGGDEGSPPVVFFKPSTAIIHDGGTVVLPEGAGQVHHEAELVAVIGKRARRVSEERALDHVMGYAVGLDLTLRDLQAEAKARGEPWALAKGFDTSAPVSTVAPREEVGDGSGLELTLRVNGEVRQQASTSLMIRGVARLVAHASRLVTLEPGDLLFTGTPSGVGPVEPGDELEATLEKVGSLTVRVEAETA